MGSVGDEEENASRLGPFFRFHPTRWFVVLLSVRLLAAAVTNIGDCDETFNYWEPTHFLMFWKGFQTWEYSPTYGLRSYFYIGIHALVGKLVGFVTSNKVFIFYAIRSFLALCSAVSEWTLLNAVRARFGARMGNLTLFFLITSAGMFTASVSYLPSTFSMYFLVLSFAAWMNDEMAWALSMTAAGVIWGWPFCIVVSVPLAFHVLVRMGLLKSFVYGLLSLCYFLVPMMFVDFLFYRKFFVAPLNIIFYNVLNPDVGPILYGVEPWYYYLINGFVNFNVVFPLALVIILVLPVFYVVRVRSKKSGKSVGQVARKNKRLMFGLVLYIAVPMSLWLLAMSVQAHKEERFLYVIYPLICVAAAGTVHMAIEVLGGIPGSKRDKPRRWWRRWIGRGALSALVCMVLCLSLSRSVGLVRNYRAPMLLWSQLDSEELPSRFDENLSICVGKEWYRFPSNFFLSSPRHHLQFIKSGFDGHLPKPFESGKNATWIIPTDMNNHNREELSRYVDVKSCDYVVDLDFEHQVEPHYLNWPEWVIWRSYPFLSSVYSPRLFRSFWIPVFSDRRNHFDPYYVLKRKE